LLTGVALALLARRLSHDPVDRDLAHALAAAILVAGVGFFSFDALSFPVATGVAFLLVGCAGALWRLQRQVTAERPVEALRAALMP
jgi:polysaccharide biosynthesis protein PslJ